MLLMLVSGNLPVTVLVFIGIGAAVQGFQNASQNMTLEFGSRHDLPVRIAIANTASELAGTIGPLLGGALAAFAGYQSVFLVSISVPGAGRRGCGALCAGTTQTRRLSVSASDKLSGRTALVTGAARGVGRATAEKLAREGAYRVPERHRRRRTRSDAPRRSAEPRCQATSRDAERARQARRSRQWSSSGSLDIVVNNAGYIWNGALHNHSDEQWDAMLDIHVTAPFRILRAYGRWLRDSTINPARKMPCRKVVNVSSVSGLFGAATQVGVFGRQGCSRRADTHARERMGALQRDGKRRRVRPHRNAPDAAIRRRAAAHRGWPAAATASASAMSRSNSNAR